MNELLRTILFLPPQATAEATAVDHLHYFVILTTMCGAALVTLFAAGFVIRYRQRAEPDEHHREAPGPTTPGWLETAFITGMFSLFILWWVLGYHEYVRLRVPPRDAMTVYVTAKQWMWKFSYP